MPRVFLYAYGPLLLTIHALVAAALCGVSVHQVVVTLQALRGRPRWRLLRVYALVAAATYGGALLSGGLLYPRYRYFIRALYLDRHAPWAANLFDFKENLATLGLPLALGALLLARPPDDDDDHNDGDDRGARRQLRQLHVAFALGLALIALFNTVAGLLCTGVRGG